MTRGVLAFLLAALVLTGCAGDTAPRETVAFERVPMAGGGALPF